MTEEPALVAVIEDDAAMRHAIERVLRLGGFGCVAVPSAEAYIALRFDTPPACAVIDVNLGAVSGLTLQAWLAVDSPALPVVMITADDSEALRRTALAQGCAGFLVKPFAGDVLVEAIRSGIASR